MWQRTLVTQHLSRPHLTLTIVDLLRPLYALVRFL